MPFFRLHCVYHHRKLIPFWCCIIFDKHLESLDGEALKHWIRADWKFTERLKVDDKVFLKFEQMRCLEWEMSDHIDAGKGTDIFTWLLRFSRDFSWIDVELEALRLSLITQHWPAAAAVFSFCLPLSPLAEGKAGQILHIFAEKYWDIS